MRPRAVACVMLLLALTLSAQSPRDLFERARMLDESNSSLNEAIALYAQVTTQTPDRQLAAAAQLRIGLLHERLGRKEDAVAAYLALDRNFSDQRDLAARARARLSDLLPSRPAASLTSARLIWTGNEVDTQGSPSPDGRHLSYTERAGHLAVRDVITNKSVRLMEAVSTAGEALALSSRFSPDGRQLAFGWLTADGTTELRIATLGRTGSRLVFRNSELFVDPFGWSADGRQLFAALEGKDGVVQIATVAVSTGIARTIRTLDWRWPTASVSPDGRWVAYAVRPPAGSAKEDVFLLAVDGSREVPLDMHPSDDSMPVWTPDGSGVVFISDRAGTLDAWFTRVVDGQPRGPATMVKQNIGRGHPLGFARDGRLYYGAMKQSLDVFLGTIDSGSSRAEPGAAAMSERFVGANYGPDWSPDGTRLLYTSQRGGGGSGRAIVVRSMADGSEHEVVPKLQYFHRPRWAPDGRGIVVQGKGVSGPAGLLTVSPETGNTTLVLKEATHQVWSPDGRTLFYSSGDVPNGRIVARNMSSGAERELHRPGGGEKAVSPDGQWLAVLVSDMTTSVVRLIPTAGGAARELVSLRPPERVFYFGGLSWAPDGRTLLFVKQAGERRELCRVDVETGRIVPTGLAPQGMTYVRLHPDGRQLAYSAGIRQQEVWILDHFLPAAAAPARQR